MIDINALTSPLAIGFYRGILIGILIGLAAISIRRHRRHQ